MNGLAKKAATAGAAVITASAIAVATSIQPPPSAPAPAPAPSVQMRAGVRLAAAFDPLSLTDLLGRIVTPPSLGEQVTGLPGQVVAIQIVGITTQQVAGIQLPVVEIKVLDLNLGKALAGVTTTPPTGPQDPLAGAGLPKNEQVTGLPGQVVAIQIVGITTQQVAGIQLPVVEIKVLDLKLGEALAGVTTTPPTDPPHLVQEIRPFNIGSKQNPSQVTTTTLRGSGDASSDVRNSVIETTPPTDPPTDPPDLLQKIRPFNIGSKLNPSRVTTTTLRGSGDALSDVRNSVIGTTPSAGAPNPSAPNLGFSPGPNKGGLIGAVKRAADSLAGGIAGPKRSPK